MKSTEVYKLLREQISPWAESEQFRKTKTMLSWQRQFNDRYLVFWFQVSRDGWDDFAGSKFIVEFQLSTQPEVGARGLRRRLGALLGEPARERLRNIQNEVILSLPKPPPDNPLLQMPKTIRDCYLQKFQPVVAYSTQDDIWLRYYTPEHVTRWGHFVRECMPDCIQKVQKWS